MQPKTTMSVVQQRASSGSQRAIILSLIAILVLGGLATGIFLFLQHEQDLRTGHWVAVATSAPGEPTPTVPPGAFAFKDAGGNLIIYYPPADAPIAVTWQTYRDPTHGYRLELPGNWTQRDQSPILPGTRMLCPPVA